MSELSDKVQIDQTNDLEQFRLNILKYVNYGKRLQAEESGTATKEQVTAMVQSAVDSTAEVIFKELDALEAQVSSLQMQVEIGTEKEGLASLRLEYANDPAALEVLANVASIIADVDAKHTAIMKDVKLHGYNKIKASFNR